jgi:hypothetical protein
MCREKYSTPGFAVHLAEIAVTLKLPPTTIQLEMLTAFGYRGALPPDRATAAEWLTNLERGRAVDDAD